MEEIPRREFLAVVGGATAVGIAGCTGQRGEVSYAGWNMPRFGTRNTAYNPNASAVTDQFSVEWTNTTPARPDSEYLAPALSGSTVYHTGSSKLVGYNFESGNKTLDVKLPAEPIAGPSTGAEAVICPTAQGVVAVDEDGSEIMWRAAPGPVKGGVTIDDGVVFALLNTGGVAAIDGDDGTVLWTDKRWDPAGNGPPVVTDDVVVPRTNGIGIIRTAGSLRGDELQTFAPTDSAVPVDVPAPEGSGAPDTTLVSDGNRVFYGDDAGYIYAVNSLRPTAGDSPVDWQASAQTTGDFAHYNQRLFVPTQQGLTALDTRTGFELWDEPVSFNDTTVTTAPTVSGGVVYLVVDGVLYALSTATGDEIGKFRVADAAAGDVVLSGSNVFVHTAGTETEETATAGTATPTGTPTDPTVGRRLFDLSGEPTVTQLQAMQSAKLELAEEIDRLSVPIEPGRFVDEGAEPTFLRDEQRARELTRRIIEDAEPGDALTIRTARDTIERARWGEEVTRRALEIIGPKGTHIGEDEYKTGDFVAYDTGLATYRLLIDFVLTFLPIKKVVKGLKAGTRAVGKAIGKVGGAANRAGSRISTGFQKTANVASTRIKNARSKIAEEWQSLKTGVSNFRTVMGNLAMRKIDELLEDARDGMLGQLTGDYLPFKSLMNDELGKSLSGLWEGLSPSAPESVKNTAFFFKTLVLVLRRQAKDADPSLPRLGGKAGDDGQPLRDDISEQVEEVVEDAREFQQEKAQQLSTKREQYSKYENALFEPDTSPTARAEPGDSIVQAAAAEAATKADVVDATLTELTEGGAMFFGLAASEAFEVGEILNAGPLSTAIGGEKSLKKQLDSFEAQLDDNFDQLSRTDGLPGQNAARNARTAGIEIMNEDLEDQFKPALQFSSNDDLSKILEALPDKSELVERVPEVNNPVDLSDVISELLTSFVEGNEVLTQLIEETQGVGTALKDITLDGIEMMLSKLLVGVGDLRSVASEAYNDLPDKIKSFIGVAKWIAVALFAVFIRLTGTVAGWSSIRRIQNRHATALQAISQGETL